MFSLTLQELLRSCQSKASTLTPGRPSFRHAGPRASSLAVLAACLACLAVVTPAQAAKAAGKRSLVLPRGTVAEWTLPHAAAESAPPVWMAFDFPGIWKQPFARLLPESRPATAVAMQAQRYFPVDLQAYSRKPVEKWIANALQRARTLEKERQLARLKEEAAEKANAAYAPPTTPALPQAPAPVSAGSLLKAEVAAPKPAEPAPVAKAPEKTPAPGAPVSAGSLLKAEVAAPKPAEPAPVAKAPEKTPAPGAPVSAGSLLKAEVAAPKTPAPAAKAPEKAAALAAPAAPATPAAPGAPVSAGSLLKAEVTAPKTPAPAPAAKAPGKELAALTPQLTTTPPAVPPAASIVPKASASRNATQDPAVLTTPEGKHAHDSFRQFCTMFVQKVETSYDKGTTSNVKVEQRGPKYVAQYMSVDHNSIHLLVKPSGYDHTPFVGVLQYSEQLFEAEGDSAQAAKAGAFKMINSITVRELFRYANKKWQF